MIISGAWVFPKRTGVSCAIFERVLARSLLFREPGCMSSSNVHAVVLCCTV